MNGIVFRLALVAGGLFGASGCHWLAVGDSVMVGAQPQIEATLGSEAGVDAVIGRGPDDVGYGSTSLRQAIVNGVGQIEPGGWLIVQEAGDHAVPAEFVQWVVDYVDDDVCVAWVTPNNIWKPEQNAASVAAIEELLPQQPCHTMVRWDQVDIEGQGITKDGLHLTDEGYHIYAAMITEAVR